MFEGFPSHWSTLKKLIWLKKAVLSAASWTYKTVTGSLLHITDALAGDVSALSVDIRPVQSGSGDPAPDNVRPISGWTEVKIWRDAVHDTTGNPVLTIDLDGTIYGGTLDVLTGVLTVDREIYDLGSRSWVKPGTGDYFYSVGIASVVKSIPDNDTVPNFICSNYAATTRNLIQSVDYGISQAINGNIQVRDKDLNSMTTTEFKDAMSGVKLVYELATPQTIQLDPETLTLLSGENYVWCDTGDISLTYKAAEPSNKVGTAKVGTAKAG